MSRIDIESTERMIKSLTKFNMTQEEMTNALKKVYDSIAADCSDSKIRELGEALNEVETTMNKSSVEVTNLITKLQLIKGYLNDIKIVRLHE